ncbi:ABC transporter ATP-binding protein [Rugosimonospora acidiphila]|uniref:ABC transporter ATP-binding protein n=1 Tax=Rugosimonospora acidiphila TaxID=556531 RepID=A0ABP9RUF5_9ACTN
MSAALLDVRDVRAGYGGTETLRGASLHVDPAEIVALLGENGAGKTTLARVVSGLHRARTGSVYLAGRDITGLAPHQIVRHGLAHVSAGRRVFASLTIEQNLTVAARRRDRPLLAGRLSEVYETFPALRNRRRLLAAALSGGEQQMLVIGRGLMSAPQLLVVDEPSSGLAPAMIDALAAAIRALRDAGTATLLIEQHRSLAERVADRMLSLREGRIEPAGSAPPS